MEVIIIKNYLIKYTDKELKNYEGGKVKIVKNDNDITSFIKKAKMFPTNSKLYYGKIGKELSNRIKNNLGIDLENYNISLKAYSIRHILNRHGNNKEKLRGQIPVTYTDFKLVQKIISDYDLIINSGSTKNGKMVITFVKEINDKYYLVNYVSDKNHNLEIQTMWKQKKNSATGDNAIISPI